MSVVSFDDNVIIIQNNDSEDENLNDVFKINEKDIVLSGQCSPVGSGGGDSGTCSDLENVDASPPLHHHKKLLKSCESDTSSVSTDSIQYHEQLEPSDDFCAEIDDRKFFPSSLLEEIRNYKLKNRGSSDEFESDDDDDEETSSDEEDYDLNYCDIVICEKRDESSVEQLKKKYSHDKFFKFHINEHSPDFRAKQAHEISDENFAGYKDIRIRTATIRSNKGTVRGMKNRVKNGIATFLQLQDKNAKVIKKLHQSIN